MDEDNYKEAIDASFKVFAPQGISKYMIINHDCYFKSNFLRNLLDMFS